MGLKYEYLVYSFVINIKWDHETHPKLWLKQKLLEQPIVAKIIRSQDMKVSHKTHPDNLRDRNSPLQLFSEDGYVNWFCLAEGSGWVVGGGGRDRRELDAYQFLLIIKSIDLPDSDRLVLRFQLCTQCLCDHEHTLWLPVSSSAKKGLMVSTVLEAFTNNACKVLSTVPGTQQTHNKDAGHDCEGDRSFSGL